MSKQNRTPDLKDLYPTLIVAFLLFLAFGWLFYSQDSVAVAPIPATDTQPMERKDSLIVARLKHKSVGFTWDTPTLREDGSALPLDEIQTYIIEYTVDSQTRSVLTGRVNSFALHHLTRGVCSFRIATIDSDGVQGNYSEPVILTL